MAGSSLPLCWRNPYLEYDNGTNVEEALSIGYGGIEAYGYHALETLQCMIERRKGGETGVVAVQLDLTPKRPFIIPIHNVTGRGIPCAGHPSSTFAISTRISSFDNCARFGWLWV